VFPVCTPDIAERLRHPRDLATAPIVRDANTTLDWSLWLREVGAGDVTVPRGHEYTDASLALDAAIAGQGVMLAWQILAYDALAAGRLVAPFAERVTTGLGYYVVTSAVRRPPEKVRAFVAWLRSEMPR
jgi:DNA-binding transcriptional LysR family regulator